MCQFDLPLRDCFLLSFLTFSTQLAWPRASLVPKRGEGRGDHISCRWQFLTYSRHAGGGLRVTAGGI